MSSDIVKHEHSHTYSVDKKYEERDLKRDSKFHNWKTWAAIVYLLICLFDFIVVPAFIGLFRDEDWEIKLLQEMSKQKTDPSVQIRMIDAYEKHYRWEPNTLKFGGIFHFSFGAILTGVAVTGYRGGLGKPPTPPH